MKTFLILLTLTFSVFTFGQTKYDRAYLVKVGEQAPDFTMKLTNGKTVRLSDLTFNGPNYQLPGLSAPGIQIPSSTFTLYLSGHHLSGKDGSGIR